MHARQFFWVSLAILNERLHICHFFRAAIDLEQSPTGERTMLITPWSLGGGSAKTRGDKLGKKLNAEQSSLRAVSQNPSLWH